MNKIDTLECGLPRFGKKEFASTRIRIDKKMVKVKMVGDIVRPLDRNEGDYGLNYQLCVRFDEEDCDLLDHIVESMGEVLDDFEAKPAHREGLMYLKVPTDPKHTRFKCEMNLPLTPLKLKHDLNEQDEEITVEAVLTGWCMMGETKRFGLRYKVTKLHFGPVTKTAPKKKRKPEDEEPLLEVHTPSPVEVPPAPKKKKKMEVGV